MTGSSYLLDTNVISALMKQEPQAVEPARVIGGTLVLIRLACVVSLCLLIAGCSANERLLPYEAAHRWLRAGMSQQEAERILLPHAEIATLTLTSATDFGPVREYFALPNGQQTWIDLRDDVVTRVGPIEPRTKWLRSE